MWLSDGNYRKSRNIRILKNGDLCYDLARKQEQVTLAMTDFTVMLWMIWDTGQAGSCV